MILPDVKLDYDDVLICPKPSHIESRKQVNLEVEYPNIGYKGIPIMAANMDGVGIPALAKVLAKYNISTVFVKSNPNYSVIDYSMVTVSQNDYNKNNYIYPEYLCLDVANGYRKDFLEFVSQVRKDFPNKVIIAGNVVTRAGTRNLIEAGADIVKVGLGSGSVCTTRIKTGVGYPQVSAVMECANAAHELSKYIIADGGCRTPGDIAKAFVAGADFVMLGGMLAGHQESSESEYVEFHGNAYFNNEDYKTAEGKQALIKNRGPIENTIKDILGGLRSACSYVGAENLLELRNANLIRVNRQYKKVFDE